MLDKLAKWKWPGQNGGIGNAGIKWFGRDDKDVIARTGRAIADFMGQRVKPGDGLGSGKDDD